LGTQNGFFQPVRRSNVVEDIIEKFKLALINGEFRAGQRLPSEPELAEELGVGRSTVREAMKILAAVGAVEVRRGDGTYVSDGLTPAIIDPLLFAVLVEPQDVSDLYELRLMIEIGCNKLAAVKATEEDFARMEAAIQEMETYLSQGGRDSAVLANLNLKFHTAILEATRNPLIIKVGGFLNRMVFESLKRVNATPEGVQWTLARHRHILEILKLRDPSQVEEAITTSLGGWKRGMDQLATE
jgi:DNA-binding FadR family transcriptional regulator